MPIVLLCIGWIENESAINEDKLEKGLTIAVDKYLEREREIPWVATDEREKEREIPWVATNVSSAVANATFNQSLCVV